MKLSERWELGGAQATVYEDGEGVALVHVVGPVTHGVRSGMAGLMEERFGDGLRADAMVVSVNCAMLLTVPADLDEWRTRPDGPARVPAALVVPPESVPVFRRYAWQLALRGIVRVIFTDASLALAWARKKAQAAR